MCAGNPEVISSIRTERKKGLVKGAFIEKTPARVLFVINSLAGGGAERVMSTILRESEDKRASFEIHLALLDQETRAYELPDWIEVHQLKCRFSLVRSIVQLGGLVRRLAPACIVSFLTRANVACCLVGGATPVIISERINTDMQLGNQLRGRLSKLMVGIAYPRASRVIAVAEGVRRTLVSTYGVANQKIDVIANPVDVESIARKASAPVPDVQDEPYAFAMGRLVEQKNFQLLISAFATAGIPGKLLIAGEGPERKNLTELAVRLGVADRVVLTGFLANPYPFLARAQTFVLCSNAEGFPNALVEALSLGIPVIATNCADGPAEILAGVERQFIQGSQEQAEGILVPVNDLAAMAAALQKLQNAELRERMSGAARERARHFELKRAVSRYWKVIERQLAETRADM